VSKISFIRYTQENTFWKVYILYLGFKKLFGFKVMGLGFLTVCFLVFDRALLTFLIVVVLYLIIAACCGGISLPSCRS